MVLHQSQEGSTGHASSGTGHQARKRSVRTTDSRMTSPIFPNLYRNHLPDRHDRSGVADFPTSVSSQASATSAAILEACSRKVIGLHCHNIWYGTGTRALRAAS